MTTVKNSVKQITASVSPQVAARFGQRTCRSSFQDPSTYPHRPVAGFAAVVAIFFALTLRFVVLRGEFSLVDTTTLEVLFFSPFSFGDFFESSLILFTGLFVATVFLPLKKSACADCQ